MKALLASTYLFLLPTLAVAHGVGEVYNLPIPLKYYIVSSAFTVALSFFILGLFFSKLNKSEAIEKTVPFRGLSKTVTLTKYAALFIFAVIVLAGYIGKDYFHVHITPLFFWIYFMTGMGIVSVIIGNAWEKINPFKTITDIFRRENSKQRSVPSWISNVLLFLFIWFELVSFSSNIPSTISTLLVFYLGLCFIGSHYFHDWYERGDFFSVLFGHIGKLARYRINESNDSFTVTNEQKKLANSTSDTSQTIFVSLLLSGATFDSVKETAVWFNLSESVGFQMTYSTLRIWNTIGLGLTPLCFIITYLFAIWVMKKITHAQESLLYLARRFTYSLIPIAFGYILAHNFSLLITSAPQLFSLLSNPFGFGWDLFNTSHYSQTEPRLSAKLVWFMEIGLIMLAHMLGVWYAHIIALNTFSSIKVAIKSQYPLIVVMVGYTALTLWLISQPLVASKF